jgi:hypothetical protein
MAKTCLDCGNPIYDGLPCSYCISHHPNEIRFDPMHEVLLMHEKLDKMGVDLQVTKEKIERLNQIGLLHSDAFLKVAEGMDILHTAMLELLKLKNPE